MRIRAVRAKRQPSLDLVPETKHQILVDRDLGDVIKRVAGALGYKSMSGLLNDALVHFLESEYPSMELVFDAEDEVQQRRASQAEKDRRRDELIEAGQRIDAGSGSEPEERRKAERRTKKGSAALYPADQDRRKGDDRRKG